MIRVLVVDDQPLVRAGICMLLGPEDDIVVVDEASNGDEAIARARAQRPDVILMDVRMPGTDGVTATRTLAGAGLTSSGGRPIGVIVLTTYHIDAAVYAALRAGALGFLLKDAAPTEIVSAIRAVAGGEAWLDPAVARRLIDEFAARPEDCVAVAPEITVLTRREREVLTLLAHGLTNSEAALKLVISEATVKTHLAHVMTKLGVHEKAQAVAIAYQSGLVEPRRH